jgi:hypothetical protein
VSALSSRVVTLADVVDAARRDFAATEVDAVLALLATYGVEPHEITPDRIRLGVLAIARGDGAALEKWVDWAKKDWRDVLFAVQQTYGASWEARFLEGAGP